MIDRETIDRIYAAANIVDIVGDYVTLKRKGVNYLACCPFHQEKTPSFVVSPARGIYKCFGCGKGGNVVNFLMESENVTYPEALKILGKRYGIEVKDEEQTEEDIQRNNNRESMFVLNGWAAEYFSRYMYNEEEGRSVALSYFSSVRGFSDATIRKFGLGFCPSRGNRFTEDARAAGYQEEFLLSTGLTLRRESDGALRDRFYDRVMFPVHNVSGRVVAFGGRTLRTDKKVAKYQNSPESEVYDKSRELYGLFFAKKAIQQQDYAIMVEGYADVISMHQAGIENVVASSGTSLTEGQIRLLSRFTQNITMMYDGDSAGVKAALRGVDLILRENMNVKVVLLPEEHDPDTFARANSQETLRKYIEDNSQDFLAFKAKLLLGEAANDPMKRSDVIRSMVQSIALIPDRIKRTEYIKYCAEIMDYDPGTLAAEVASHIEGVAGNREAQDFVRRQQQREVQTGQVTGGGKSGKVSPPSGGTSLATLERTIAKYILKFGHINIDVKEDEDRVETHNVAEYIFSQLDSDGITFEIPVYRTIMEVYRGEWERLGVGVAVPTDYFFMSPDPEVSAMSVTLLTEDDNYVISKIWTQKEVHIESDEEQLSQAVPETMVLYKWRFLDKHIAEVRRRLAEGNMTEEEAIEAANMLTRFLSVRLTIAQITNRVI